MISRLFKTRKRLDSSKPADRLAVLNAMDDADVAAAQTTLAELAANDNDRTVRNAALEKLSDPQQLTALLASQQSSQELRRAVSEHVARLVDRGTAESLADHPAVIRVRLAKNPTAELISSILAQGDRQLLLDAVLRCPREHRETLLGHETFQQSATLQELEHRSRNHDKHTNRFARKGIEEIRRNRAGADRLTLLAQEKLAVLEKVIEVYSAQEVRKRQALLDDLTIDLRGLAESAQALASAGEEVLALSELNQRRNVVESILQAQTGAATTGAGDAPDIPGQKIDASAFEPLTQSLERLDGALAKGEAFETLSTEHQLLVTQWLTTSDQIPPTESQHAVFERVSRRLRQLADAHHRLAAADFPDLNFADLEDEAKPASGTTDQPPESAWDHSGWDPSAWEKIDRLRRGRARTEKLLRKVAWPDWAAPPQSLCDVRAASEKLNQRLCQWDTETDRLVERLASRLNSLAEQIDQGELKKAKAEAGALRSMIQALPGAIAQPLNRKLGKCSAKLAELSDWQTFATSPKRESLCQMMAELAESPLAPKTQAERIKTLRADWNELGPIGRAADHRHLERFNELAETAFEPCRAYFAEQADERSANLAARIEICDSLARYLASTNWQEAEFKAAEQIMRAAREEWRKFHPVDRSPGKPVEERFESLQSELNDQIKAEWARNLALKEQIVDEARSLVESEQDVAAKVATAKSLQQRWKTVGLTPRRPDQSLWREFRKSCDAIFEAREDAQKDADEAIRHNQQHAAELLESFRQTLSDETTAIAAAQLREFQTRFEESPRLPERLQRPLDREFSQLSRSAEQLLRDARAAAERARLTTLQDLDAKVSILEQQHRNGESVEFEPPDPLFASRWAEVDNPVPLEALQRQVVCAEIAAELESPEADRDLRLTIQVELMNTGRGLQALIVAPDELLAEWCQVGPKDSNVDPLRQRFFQAIEVLASR